MHSRNGCEIKLQFVRFGDGDEVADHLLQPRLTPRFQARSLGWAGVMLIGHQGQHADFARDLWCDDHVWKIGATPSCLAQNKEALVTMKHREGMFFHQLGRRGVKQLTNEPDLGSLISCETTSGTNDI